VSAFLAPILALVSAVPVGEAASSTVAEVRVSCGSIEYRCPADLTFVFGEVPAIADAKLLGCGFAREATTWRCRAESTESELVHANRRVRALTERLAEKNAELAVRPWWTGGKALALSLGGVLGGAGGAALPFDTVGERAASGGVGVLVGMAVSLVLVLAFEP
jgi:hypothetical protein